jgi:hypothetical protein
MIQVDTQILNNLCLDLLILKKSEKEIADLRIVTENKIAAMVATKEEGTDKADTDKYKVTVTSKLTRTLDDAAYFAIEQAIPTHLRPVYYKPTIDLKILRQLEVVSPDLIPGFVTTKAAKAQIKIDEVA